MTSAFTSAYQTVLPAFECLAPSFKYCCIACCAQHLQDESLSRRYTGVCLYFARHTWHSEQATLSCKLALVSPCSKSSFSSNWKQPPDLLHTLLAALLQPWSHLLNCSRGGRCGVILWRSTYHLLTGHSRTVLLNLILHASYLASPHHGLRSFQLCLVGHVGLTHHPA